MAANNQPSVILVIDDNEINVKIVVDYLQAHGFQTIMARNGNMGLYRAKFMHPDLIFLDVMMPDIDGFEVCHRLKADEQTQNIPIIFMTALDDVEDKVRGFEVGAVDYITKPLEEKEVLARAKTHLKLQELQNRVVEQNNELRAEIIRRKQLEAALNLANQKLAELANIDSLTQIANRRYFDTHLAQAWQNMTHEQPYLSLIMVDVDYFKNYNDYYGHQAGDECLQKVAQLLKQVLKQSTDLAARYGGEEFALILVNTNEVGARDVAQEIQSKLAQLQLPHAKSEISSHVTCSYGLATVMFQPSCAIAEFIAVADKHLYLAKSKGRNQIIE